MFPLEIIHIVLEELFLSGGKLSPLLFVSRDFRYLALQKLLRRVELICPFVQTVQGLRGKRRSVLLFDILSKDPSLLRAIRSLSVFIIPTFSISSGRKIPTHVSSQVPEDVPPGFSFPALLDILCHAPINSFKVESTRDSASLRSSDSTFGPVIDSATLNALVSVRSKPTIQKLVLLNLSSVPYALFAGTSHQNSLTDLVMRIFAPYDSEDRNSHRLPTFDEADFVEPVEPKTAPRVFSCLERLDLHHIGDGASYFHIEADSEDSPVHPLSSTHTSLTQRLASSVPKKTLPALKSLIVGNGISLNERQSAIVANIIKRALALEEFGIRDVPSLGQDITMDMCRALHSHHRTLRSLSFTIAYVTQPSGYLSPVQSLTGFLSECLPLPAVEVIRLEVNFLVESSTDADNLGSESFAFQWDRMLVTVLQRLPSLRRVELDWKIRGVFDEVDTAWIDTIKRVSKDCLSPNGQLEIVHNIVPFKS